MNKYIKTKNNILLLETTTERQKANGTEVYTLITNEGEERFALYKSGYVRRVDTNKTPYQLNKTYEKTITRTITRPSFDVFDSAGDVITTIPSSTKEHTFTTLKRSLIKSRNGRVEFLKSFVDRNYSNQICRK